MAVEEMSPQRKSAYYRWRQAQQEAQKGHFEKAVELARSALEEDPEYIDLRMWLAQQFIRHDEPRRASHELEEIIHIQQGNEQAWELLRQVDPAAAARLERLREIAPDPFVSRRTAPLTDDVADVEEFVTEDDWETGGDDAERSIGPDPFISHVNADDFVEPDELVDQTAGESTSEPTSPATVAPARAPAAAPAPATAQRGGYAWEYEQDREFLAKWEAEPVVRAMTAKIQELWHDLDAWDSVLALCAHADKHLHPQIFHAAQQAAAKLAVETPELFVVPERCMHPVIIKDHPPTIAVPTGLMRAMTPEQMLFQIGREIGHIHTGYVAQMQVVKVITARRTALAGDLASTLNDFLTDRLRGWDDGLDKERIQRLKKLGHAWQQRCELTADRAGLICCGDIEVACTTMAKTTARSVDEAAVLTVERFLKQFEGRDVGALAAIPVEESPSRNPQYVAYRIHMLRWWATTPLAKSLLGK